MYHRTGLDGWGIHAPYGGEISSPLCFATPTALPRPTFTQHCYIMDTFFSPSHSRNNTKQIQSSWRRRQRVPPKHQNKLFIKSNVRTRRDLDFCCAFGCSRFKSQHRNPLSWFRFIRSCRLNLQERTWIHTNYSMTPSWHIGTQKAHIKINVVPVPCNVLITMDLIRLIVHIHAYKFVLS